MDINFPCTCGHKKKAHRNKKVYDKKNLYHFYTGCAYLGISTTIDDCPCQKFEADNLKYLEECYEITSKRI